MNEKKIRVLVAEDDSDLMEQLDLYLSRAGYEVLKAYTQEEAEKIIAEKDFEAAVLDLMMENPDSGFVLSHKIKKTFPKKPVIIITSVTKETGFYFDKQQDKNNWIKADTIIQKELRFEQLEKELKRLLGR
jgi:DNA-binding response OmpR family regulator